MLKEVGVSGQVSLGKRFAGLLFDVVFHADGRIEMLPMRAVPAPRPATASKAAPTDGWVPPGGYPVCHLWAQENRDALEAYAAQVEHEGTAAEQLQQFLDENPTEEGR
jgi:hypothetical protein